MRHVTTSIAFGAYVFLNKLCESFDRRSVLGSQRIKGRPRTLGSLNIMKLKSTLLTALFGLSAACAPVDNDDTAAVKSQNSTLQADTMLDMINEGPFDAHRFPAFNTRPLMSVRADI